MKYDNDYKHHCTTPTIFHAREWFENRFGDACKEHDEAYVNRTGKTEADIKFLKVMWARGPKILCIPTALFFLTLGYWYYYT